MEDPAASGFRRAVWSLLSTRTALIAGIVIVSALLLLGVAHYGMVNSLPAEQHVERSRAGNRLIITEDKDGCLDMRTLGRSNGVYMAIAPCKPSGMDKDKDKQPQP